VYIYYSLFQNNSATGGVGGGYAMDLSVVQFIGLAFHYNSALVGGGAISLATGPITTLYCDYKYNSADRGLLTFFPHPTQPHSSHIYIHMYRWCHVFDWFIIVH
jgi:predicted outer membrane repeat protein